MSRLAYFFQPLIKVMPFIAGYLLVAVIGLQSVFAAADFCTFGETASDKTGYKIEYASQEKAGQLDISGLDADHDDCAECHCKSCPCCANVTFALAPLFPLFESLNPILTAFKATRFDNPYYLLLRPPKI